ncbi:gliding motility-associated C-terminal domain-containing protein [Maribacter polysaccharolyticus]|uniref:gliding motility-associated C-terminal domain-containing protein n=1 Tax=Maribacter polysaccharolyticus TaxID=3020831 RepID=UPI00237FC228|nr:gliding motility-associated C-terminal domain-containing protein [Maribacter polysaccharolyticus]MDE3743625.1 gliding motility-associated C-terminal domain-containing protein [Maribacter polysaccharolyticus]
MNVIKQIFVILIFTAVAFLNAQDAVHNYGPMQIHGSTMVGFHMDVINDGDFDQNSGLVGFYGFDKSITVSGSEIPVFYDAEIAVDNGLYLNTQMDVTNNVNLVVGDVITPRINSDIFTNFLEDAFYVGENDVSLIDGYAAFTNKDNFTFPVGDDNRLRPLGISSDEIDPLVKCAYFYEDPNSPSVFGKSFETGKIASEYMSVSDKEFWHLEGEVMTSVTLTWDEDSNIGALAEYLGDLKVVGWHKEGNQWVNLGNTNVEGGLVNGSITSEPFIPNDYEILTLGGNADEVEQFETLELDNYYMTPNGDGKNDYLVLDGLEASPNNSLQIFNRYGVLVYSKENYQNEFNGVSNRNSVISRDSGLATGIYFYIITMHDLKKRHQGYLYLSVKQ